MSFVTVLALAVAALVAVPYLAHRLRRRSAQDEAFPPARLVQPAPPHARRRSRLEDRALFATRSAAVVALAVLGATPLIRCTRLSLERAGGASIAMAIVVDDSMSMRADAGGRSRFERARRGALELLVSTREGDAVAIVLAGAPARVALAATTNLATARQAIQGLSPSDRGTDLEGAVALARGLVVSLPQIDRRVVVLSDLADGHPEGPPLGDFAGVPLWVALPELRVDKADCGVMRADQRGPRVRVAVACGPGQSAVGREVVVEDALGKPLGRAPVTTAPSAEVALLLPTGDAHAARAKLSGRDAIAEDDTAPVVPEGAPGAIAVVIDSSDEAVATGGAPIVEQALGALKLEVEATPIPAVPDRAEDLAGRLGVLIDDPPGLTPEQRRALASYVQAGGVGLLALGPHAAAAPLGATFEPLLTHAVSWRDTTQQGASPGKAVGPLAESAPSLADLGASRRAVLAPEDVRGLEVLVEWTDGQPLVARRTMGRGELWLVTLPFSVDASDLALRPAFLALLSGWVRTAQERAAPQRSEVGVSWRFPGAGSVVAHGPTGAVATTIDNGVARIVPSVLGAYQLVVDGKEEVRVAAPSPSELDLRPRPSDASTAGAGVGERRAAVDVSGPVALVLLALVTLEMVLRLISRRES